MGICRTHEQGRIDGAAIDWLAKSRRGAKPHDALEPAGRLNPNKPDHRYLQHRVMAQRFDRHIQVGIDQENHLIAA